MRDWTSAWGKGAVVGEEVTLVAWDDGAVVERTWFMLVVVVVDVEEEEREWKAECRRLEKEWRFEWWCLSRCSLDLSEDERESGGMGGEVRV